MSRRKKRSLLRTIPYLFLLAATAALIGRYSLQRVVPDTVPLPRSVDVIVVGSGLTGWTAATTAAEAGVEVYYLSVQEPDTGGFPAFSPAFWAADREVDEGEVPYTAEEMAYDIFLRGGEAGNVRLITRIAGQSGESLAWLETIMETSFQPTEIPGRYRPQVRSMQFVYQAVRDAGQNRIETVSVTQEPVEIILENDRVRGMNIRNADGRIETVYAQAIILADGGYGSNPIMLERYASGFPSVLRPEGGHTGVGLQLGLDAGALTEHLEKVDLLPVLLPQGERVLPEALQGAVVTDQFGRRVDTQNSIEDTIASAEGRIFIIKGNGQDVDTGTFLEVESTAVLASGLGIDTATASSLVSELSPPYFIASAGIIALTPGGLLVDEEFRVLKEAGPILGLYAAGEIASGLHGEQTIIPLVFSEAVTAARSAGEAAARWAQR